MSENTSSNYKISGKSKIKLILRSGLILGILAILFFIMVSEGITNAWYSPDRDGVKIYNAGAETVNTGTLHVEVVNLNIKHDGSWHPGECLHNQYLITNIGTKEIYVRASFEGFWKRILHHNTATVTATYNGHTLSDSDQAHLSFGEFSPSYQPNFTPEATKGHFDNIVPEPSRFPMIWNYYITTETGVNKSFRNFTSINELSGYPKNCSGPAVTPYANIKLSEMYPKLFRTGLNDPDEDLVKKYLGPKLCEGFHRFKINFDQDGIPNGRTYLDGETGFIITFYKTVISGKYYYAYQANYPIYHLLSSDSNEEGIFYSYYPSYSEGVLQDCGLSQPLGAHSHITLYYCVPPLSPSIKIVKQVSINYGDNWINADEFPGPELIVSTPKFRFLVTNTGNVPLENIVVEDNVFGLIGTKDYLDVGESLEFIKDKYSISEVYLDTDNVTIELCTVKHDNFRGSDWEKVGNYYYYLHKINTGQSVTICLRICLTDKTDVRYDGAEFHLNSFFEAVQSENGMVNYNWSDNPY